MNRDRFAAIVADELGEPFVYSYLDRSGFTDGTAAVLYPWSYQAERALKERCAEIMKREGVRLGPVVADHLKPKQRRAA